MLTSFRKRWKKFNLQQFLIFVGVALVLWLSVQLSVEQEFSFETEVSLTNFPKDISVKNNKVAANFSFKGNGFNFKMNVSNWKKVTLPVDQLKDSLGNFFFTEEVLLSALSNTSASEFLSLKEIPPPINYNQYYAKYLPVRSQIDFKFSPSFIAFEEIQFEKDSVKVIGSKESLEKVKFIQTEKVTFDNVSQSLSGEVRLQASKEYGHMLEQDKLHFSLKVEQFSEESLRVPVSLVNLSQNATFISFPSTVLVFYKVSLANEASYDPSYFEVQADFLLAEQNFKELPLVITKIPTNVTDVWITPESISYLYNRGE